MFGIMAFSRSDVYVGYLEFEKKRIDMARRDEYGRYTWDEEQFEAKFQARMKAEKQAHEVKRTNPGELRPLRARESFVELAEGINRRKVIGDNVPLSKIGHYSCPVCELYFKDSSVYLRHLNSPQHNQKMGMSLRVRPVTDDEVLERVRQWEDFYMTGTPVPRLFDEGT
jgi:hypothetical protein